MPAPTTLNDREFARYTDAFKNVARAAVLAAGSLTIATPATGRKLRVQSFHVTTSAATVLTVKLGTRVLWERDFGAAGGADVLLPPPGELADTAGDTLTVSSSAAATIGGSASVREE